MQQRVVPADLGSVSSSAYRATEHDEDDSQRTVSHGYQPTYVGSRSSQSRSGSAHRSSTTEHDEDESQRTVVHGYQPVYGGSASRTSSGRIASESSRVGYVAAPVYTSGGIQSSQRSSASNSETEYNESRKPIPVGQHVSISARPGTTNVLAVPVRVINTHGIPTEHQNYYVRNSDQQSSGSESSSTRAVNPTSTTYRVTYSPSRNVVVSDKIASTSESDSSRVAGTQYPDKLTNYNSFNVPESSSQTRFRSEDRESNSEQVRVAPVLVTYPYNGGSSRAASTGSSQSGYTQSRVDPGFSINTIDSSAASRNQVLAASRRTSGSEQQGSAYTGNSGSTYYVPVAGQTRTQTQHQASSGGGSQTQYQRGGSFSPYVPSRTSSSHLSNSQFEAGASDKLAQRFGTGSYTSNDDLRTYMTETERLARLQQQQIASSSRGSDISSSDANRRTIQTASNLDSAAADFVRSSNLANRNSEFDSNTDIASGTGGTGYQKVRSWNKQSKWASGNGIS